jgi:hypothetical protein
MYLKSHKIFLIIALGHFFLYAGLMNAHSFNTEKSNKKNLFIDPLKPKYDLVEKTDDFSKLNTSLKTDPKHESSEKKEEKNELNESNNNNTNSNKFKKDNYPNGFTRKMVSDMAFVNKLNELDKSNRTYNTDEFGYAYIIDQGFIKLSRGRNGHSLSFADLDLNRVLGFIHTHPCGKENIFNGVSKLSKESISMPSPTDVNVFKRLLIRAKVNNRKLEDVFMTVISCKGIFDLKYKGDGENIKNWDMTEKTYTSYFKKTKDPVKAFKKYLDEVVNQHGNGFELHKYVKDKDTDKYKILRQVIISNKLIEQPIYKYV